MLKNCLKLIFCLILLSQQLSAQDITTGRLIGFAGIGISCSVNHGTGQVCSWVSGSTLTGTLTDTVKSIVNLTPKVGRLVLKDLAELDMRREDAKADSTTIVDLYSANFEQEQEAGSLRKALKECVGGSADKDKLIVTQGKEIRKQKRLKVLAIVGIAVLAVVEIIVPK